MTDIIATIITALIFILPVVAVFFLFRAIAKGIKNTKPRQQPKETKAVPKYEYETYWVVDSDYADKYYNFYRQDLTENPDYDLTAKELKEDFEDEKVYRYEPYELPLKMEGLDVYSYRDENEWEKIGRLKKTAKIDGDLTLALYPNIYKYVTEEGIQRESDDHYFGVEVRRIVE